MTALEDEKEAQIQHFAFLDKMLALFFKKKIILLSVQGLQKTQKMI